MPRVEPSRSTAESAIKAFQVTENGKMRERRQRIPSSRRVLQGEKGSLVVVVMGRRGAWFWPRERVYCVGEIEMERC